MPHFKFLVLLVQILPWGIVLLPPPPMNVTMEILHDLMYIKKPIKNRVNAELSNS